VAYCWQHPTGSGCRQRGGDQGAETCTTRSARGSTLSRLIDVVLATTMLLALLPIMLLIAVCVVAESRGPVFYRATRVGYRGRELRMLKFRKMAVGASGPALTAASDARLTRVGSILAATKLDELPQLINVVRGQMSLVGPRPEDPEFVASRPAEFGEILSVRPGMSGLCQLAFACESRILSADDPVGHYLDRILPQKVRLDQLYVRRRGVWLDARIMLWTIAATVLRIPVSVDRATAAMHIRHRPPARATAGIVLGPEPASVVAGHARPEGT
jgi:lipopolysaccharide/colanic/teichoic acid biosynthesis glycosyltransferase